MVRAALNGMLDDVSVETDPVFGLQVPTTCPDVPSEVLQPRETWPDNGAYDEQARKLAEMFEENFKQFKGELPGDVRLTNLGQRDSSS
jgi:phosphoenolpyruvate carboxykinase (ATP)